MGYDQHSLGYRDLEGTKVHKALREPYGKPFKEGDVVGCLLHMPPGGARHSIQPEVCEADRDGGVICEASGLRTGGLGGSDPRLSTKKSGKGGRSEDEPCLAVNKALSLQCVLSTEVTGP